jgi:hypothetical protein
VRTMVPQSRAVANEQMGIGERHEEQNEFGVDRWGNREQSGVGVWKTAWVRAGSWG